MAEMRAVKQSLTPHLWYQEALVKKEGNRAQLWFSVDVLDRYRQETGFSVTRTDNAGRVKAERQWNVDFGILDTEGTIHASLGDLLALPKREREHWTVHLLTPPLNERFLQLQLQPGGCIDDGEVRSF